MESQLENNVVRFVQVLRSLGLQVGISETMDALGAVQNIELTNRKQFQAALKSTLIKDIAHATLFNSAFEAFFVQAASREEQVKGQAAFMDAKKESQKDLIFQDTPLDLDESYLDMYTNLSDESRQQVKDFLKKTSEGKNVSAKFKPIVENIVRGALDYHQGRQQGAQYLPVEMTGVAEVDAVLHQVAQDARSSELFFQDMASISEDEYAQTTMLIRRLSRQLATRISRRYKKSAKIKRIDVRRSIRAGIRYGGVMMDLKHKQKKVQKPELLMLCDVSGSMIRYSRFTLQFMSGLSEVLPRMNAFVFAEKLEKINIADFSSDILAGTNNWGEGTNLYLSLKRLLDEYRHLLKSTTVLMILSDTKTLQPEQAAVLLKHIKGIVREIIWLNPMPGAQWPKYNSVTAFKQHANMWECSSLAQLSIALRSRLG